MRARKGGGEWQAGSGSIALRIILCIRLSENSVAMSLEHFGFSSSASSATASASLPAGEVVSRANVICARPRCAHV